MLEIENVSKTFHPNAPNEVRGLHNINLTLEEGSFVIGHRHQWFGQVDSPE